MAEKAGVISSCASGEYGKERGTTGWDHKMIGIYFLYAEIPLRDNRN